MNVSVYFTQEAPAVVSEALLTRVVEETLSRCCPRKMIEKDSITLNAIAVTSEKIQELNKRYRRQDRTTDILSFGEYTDKDALENEKGGEIFLGELFFCPAIIKRAATEDGLTVEHEMIDVFAHGVLHLLGYDHGKEMFTLQDAVTERFVKELTATPLLNHTK